MPRIIPYETVLERMTAQGLQSLYYNSGAFGFARDVATTTTIGWVGPPDDTIRPAAKPFTRQVAPPYESSLARLAARAWREQFPGPAWVMPKSHWAYELDFGSHLWMPQALRDAGVDPDALAPLNNAAAVEFAPDESAPYLALTTRLLERLFGSDFTLAWPGRPVVCTLHHHKQLWWTTADPALAAALDALVPPGVGVP